MMRADLTRPHLGAAMRRSATLAVSRNSGGAARISLMLDGAVLEIGLERSAAAADLVGLAQGVHARSASARRFSRVQRARSSHSSWWRDDHGREARYMSVSRLSDRACGHLRQRLHGRRSHYHHARLPAASMCWNQPPLACQAIGRRAPAPATRRERERHHETLRCLRGHHQRLEAVLDEAAHQLDRLVDGDAVRDPTSTVRAAWMVGASLTPGHSGSVSVVARSCCRRSPRRRS